MYYVLEIQKTDSEHVAYLVHAAATGLEGESKYHQVLAAAAISSVPVHSAILLDDEGHPVKRDGYRHGSEPGPGPEPNAEPGGDA